MDSAVPAPAQPAALQARERKSLRAVSGLQRRALAAAAACERAQERLDDARLRATVGALEALHRQHAAALGDLALGLGGEPADGPSVQRLLGEGRVLLSGLMGQRAVLRTVQAIEESLDEAWTEALMEGDLSHTARDRIKVQLAEISSHSLQLRAQVSRHMAEVAHLPLVPVSEELRDKLCSLDVDLCDLMGVYKLAAGRMERSGTAARLTQFAARLDEENLRLAETLSALGRVPPDPEKEKPSLWKRMRMSLLDEKRESTILDIVCERLDHAHAQAEKLLESLELKRHPSLRELAEECLAILRFQRIWMRHRRSDLAEIASSEQ